MTPHEADQTWGRIWARCWTDASFKTRLLADPVAVLQAEGVALPQEMQWRAVEDTAQLRHFVLPTRPTEVSDAELAHVAGGVTLHIRNDSGTTGKSVLIFQKMPSSGQNHFSNAWFTRPGPGGFPGAGFSYDWSIDYSKWGM